MDEQLKAEQVMPHLLGKTYAEVVVALSISENQGDCCGWSEWDVTDLLAGVPNKDEAILREVTKLEYEGSEMARAVVNFVFDLGESRGLVLGYELKAGSGSGWSYGAHCALYFKDERVAEAIW